MSKRTKLAALLIAAILLFPACARQETPVAGTDFLMDTIVEYKFYGENAQRAREAVRQTLSGIEERMSMYIDGSEIDRLNRAAGDSEVPLSPDTFELLNLCVRYGAISDGIFDVTIAPLTAEWGITSGSSHIPTQARLDELRGLINYRELILDPQKQTGKLRRTGQAVDVGGIAKGYACTAARQAAIDCGVTAGYLSIGGNVAVIGEKPGGEPFKFGVRDPRGGENDFLGVITLPDETMATSGDYERYFEQDGVRYHHILDPATGYPAKTDLISVSVVSPDGAYADFMSTYLFIKGREFVLKNLDAFDCGLIVIDRDKKVYVSERLKGNFTPADKTGTYQFEELS